MTEDPRLFANPLLEASDFDSDAGQPMVLCVIPSANDPVRFVIPAPYMELVRQFDGERTEEEAIDAFLDRHPDGFEREWLRRLVRQSLLPKGNPRPCRPGSGARGGEQPAQARFPVPQAADFPAQGGRARGPMPELHVQAAGAAIWASWRRSPRIFTSTACFFTADVDFNQLNAAGILLLMLLSTLATLCHEFGHASAAAHYGCRRMSIGWGLYIVYTVFWTNVSEAWRLPRRQRAMIDIGGVYFESVFMLLMLALYLKTGNLVFLFAFVFIDLSLLTTLNPFLRMDGYWLISDLFGIVNLRKQQTEWMGEVASKLFGGGTYVKRSSLSTRAKWALSIYSVAGGVFLI